MSMAKGFVARSSEPKAVGARFLREERRPKLETEAAEAPVLTRFGIDLERLRLYPPERSGRTNGVANEAEKRDDSARTMEPAVSRAPSGRPSPAALATTRGVLQAKLAVGSVEDPLEREADRVADKVLRMPDPAAAAGTPEEPPGTPATPSGARLSRKCASCKDDEEEKGGQVQRRAAPGAEAGLGEAPPIVEQALGGGGRPLDAPTRAYFEPRFGFDLSKVRIHTDARAEASARSVNALAYTVGRDIVFGQGRYAPGEGEGRRLLAHELAHVAQQRSGGSGLVVRRDTPKQGDETIPAGSKRIVRTPGGGALLLRVVADEPPTLPDKTPNSKGNIESETTAEIIEKKNDRGWYVVKALVVLDRGVREKRVGFVHVRYLFPVPAPAAAAPGPADRPAAPPAAGPPNANDGNAVSRELTDQDAKSCSALYQQKLCVRELGGCTDSGSRDAGIPGAADLANYNATCRDESGYVGPDVTLSEKECGDLQTPACSRGSSATRVLKALTLSVKYMPAGAAQALTDPTLMASLALSLVIGLGVYLAAWLAPEPIFTKIAAAATTIAILSTGLFTITTIKNLAVAWLDLASEAAAARSDPDLEQAAAKFGKRMGALEVELLVFLLSLFSGGRVQAPKRLPSPTVSMAQATAKLNAAQGRGVVLEGSGYRASVANDVTPGASAPSTTNGASMGFDGTSPLKIEVSPAPQTALQPVPNPRPIAAPAAAPSKAQAPGTMDVPAVAPVSGPRNDDPKPCCCCAENVEITSVRELGFELGPNEKEGCPDNKLPDGVKGPGKASSERFGHEFQTKFTLKYQGGDGPLQDCQLKWMENDVDEFEARPWDFMTWRNKLKDNPKPCSTGKPVTVIDTDQPSLGKSENQPNQSQLLRFRIVVYSANAPGCPPCQQKARFVTARQFLQIKNGKQDTMSSCFYYPNTRDKWEP